MATIVPSIHPIQNHHRGERGSVPKELALRAYEVYEHMFGSQEAMITGMCRGGFSVNEYLAFLYARSFPKDQWQSKVEEILRNTKGI